MDSIVIAKIIRIARKRSGLTQVQLAQFAGVGKTVVFDLEKGKPTVQLDSLLKVLEILNIKIMLQAPFLPFEETIKDEL
jgi:y4mF family transcriptional regulator